MRKGYFITGTDTDCGKTAVACAILRGWQSQKLRTAAFKPIATGGMPSTSTITHSTDWHSSRHQLVNSDAQALFKPR